MAASLSATVVGPAEMDSCIDHKEQWRGALLIREKKVSCCRICGAIGRKAWLWSDVDATQMTTESFRRSCERVLVLRRVLVLCRLEQRLQFLGGACQALAVDARRVHKERGTLHKITFLCPLVATRGSQACKLVTFRRNSPGGGPCSAC